MTFRHIVPFAALLFLGCGGLETPDLQHGAVIGRIAGARPGAYAYVLGSPSILAFSTGDSTFRLEGVPAGLSQIVVFDGESGAESIEVEVAGAAETSLNVDRPLRPAACVVAGASPLQGIRATGLTFSVLGTAVYRVDGQSGARLFPLPAGRFTVHAEQPGFHEWSEVVDLAEGACVSLEVDLDIEDDERRGCRSCGCDEDLACDSADGRCYSCVTDSDCLRGGSGGSCRSSTHTCVYPGTGQICQGCGADGDCASGRCSGGDYCTTGCSDSSGCPSGYDCQSGLCAVAQSCLAIAASYGATCTKDDNCRTALREGRCFPFDRPGGTTGYCSAPIQSGCPGGFIPDPAGSGYCRKS